MTSFFYRRILAALFTLFGVFFVVFISLRLVPGDPAELLAGSLASEELISSIREDYGLDKPLLIQFGIALQKLLQGDLGISIVHQIPVKDEVLLRFKNSAILGVSSIIIATSLGILFGTIAAIYHDRWLDRLIMLFVLAGISLPTFWIGLVFIIQFSVKWKLLPPQGMHSPLGEGIQDLLIHLILPAITLSLPTLALIARLTRSALLDVLNKQYILTAHSFGIKPTRIFTRHALPNVALPIITIIGSQAGYILGGTILVEIVFSWPGLGFLLMESIFNRDYPLIQGSVLISASIFVVINMTVDFLYGVFDPRVRTGSHASF